MHRVLIRDQANALFSKISFAKTSVADIAKACGLGKGTIYLYFKSKDDIVLAIIEERIAGIVAANAAFFDDLSIRLEDKIRRFFDDVVDETFALKELLVGPFENIEGKAIEQVFFKYGRYYDWCIERFGDIALPYSSYADKDREAYRANVKTYIELMIGRMVLFLVGRDWNDKEGLKKVLGPLSIKLFDSLVERGA
jgi:AcrR family transcriptional regulator